MKEDPSYDELKRQNEELRRKIQVLEEDISGYRQLNAEVTAPGFMQAILDNIQDGISVLNPDLSIRYVNSVMEKWYAANMPLIGKKCYSCYHNKTEPCRPCPSVRAKKSGKTESDIVPALNDPDSWLELFSYPFKDTITGELVGIIEFVRDISERVRSEKMLLESRERYQSLFDNSPIPLWEEDFTELFNYLDILKNRGVENFRKYFRDYPAELALCIDKIIYKDVNKATLNLFDAESKDVFFSGMDKVITESSYAVFLEEIISLANGHKEFSSEVRINSLSGRTRYIQLNLIIDDSKPGTVRALVVTPEITDRIIVQNKLRESEARFRLTFQTNPDAISLTRFKDGKYLDINSGFTHITGFEREEIIGKTSGEIEIWNDTADREQLIELIKRDKTVRNFEANFRVKNGSVIVGQMSATIINLNNEDIILAITRDVSDIKRAEKEISDSEKTLQLALEGGGLGMWDWNIQTGRVKFSEKRAKMLGYELSELETNLEFWKSLIHPDDIDEVLKSLQLHLDGKTDHYEHEFRMHTKEGSWKWIYDRGKVLEWDEEDRPLRALGTHLDITNRKLAEAETAKLTRAVENTPVSIVITDDNGIIEYVNPHFTILTGYSPEEAIGKNPNLLQSGWHSKEFYDNLWSTIKRGQIWYGEFLNKKKDNSTYWEKANISSISNENGEITHFVAIKEDITHMKKMVEDLQKAKEKAEESDRLKSAFLANMSHEIRTPMNGILGFANLLKESIIKEEKRIEYLSIIEKSGVRMLNLINDLIDISRIEAGETELYYSSTDLNNLLNELYDFFVPETNAKGIDLILNNSLVNRNIHFSTDREKLYAVLTNLVKNSIKYSDEGQIEIGCRKYNRQILFYVRDTGIGIPEDKQMEIFNRFIQVDQNVKKAYEGSGLGLAISKAYVEMMGGEIWLESKPGN
ncbi:MAG: PAS domain S-box protein, partial [Bacteroidota bacterium]